MLLLHQGEVQSFLNNCCCTLSRMRDVCSGQNAQLEFGSVDWGEADLLRAELAEASVAVAATRSSEPWGRWFSSRIRAEPLAYKSSTFSVCSVVALSKPLVEVMRTRTV